MLKAGDLIILPQDGLCEILAVDGMGAMVRPLASVRLEFETGDGDRGGGVPVPGTVAFERRKRRPFLISNRSGGE